MVPSDKDLKRTTPKFSNKPKGKINFEDPGFLHRTAMLPDRTDSVLSVGGDAEGGRANSSKQNFLDWSRCQGGSLQKAFVNSA